METFVVALPPQENHDGTLSGLALCAGVGGLELGLHIAEPQYRTACFVERDAFAAALLVARMEEQALCDAPVWDDLASFDGRPWRGVVDIITGGYPCQPFSSAGRRLGAADPRHLWPHVRRIIAECGPRWVFLENVQGHVDRGFREVRAELRGLGYCVEAELFTAAEVGAPHWRTRLFILAHANGLHRRQQGRPADGSEGLVLPPGFGSDRQSGPPLGGGPMLDRLSLDGHRNGLGTHNADSDLPIFAPGPLDHSTWHEILTRRPDLQPCLLGLDHGLAYRVDRHHAAGNGVVPLAAAFAWSILRARFEVASKIV